MSFKSQNAATTYTSFTKFKIVMILEEKEWVALLLWPFQSSAEWKGSCKGK